MTEQELIEFGYKPEQCKIGTLYLKGSVFVILNNNIADVREVGDDTTSFGIATTLDELKNQTSLWRSRATPHAGQQS